MITDEQLRKVGFFTMVLVSSVVIVQILRTLKGVFLPLVVAIFLAYLLSPPIEFCARYKVPRVVTLIVLVIILCFAGYFAVQLLILNVSTLTERLPELRGQFLNTVGPVLARVSALAPERMLEIIQSSGVSKFAKSFFQKSFSIMGMVLLTLLILIFIGSTYSRYPQILRKALSDKGGDDVIRLVKRINRQIVQYVLVKSFVSVGTGVLTGLACFLLGIEFALLWGF